MKSEFQIQMTTNAMYNFLMYHIYRGVNGAVSILGGLGLIAYYFFAKDDGGMNTWMFLAFGIVFLVYQPWTLYTKAVKQTKLNPVFKQPLRYVLTEEKIEVQQGESANELAWEQVYEVRETNRSILLYTNARNAFIWDKKQIKEQEEQIRKMLAVFVDPNKLKLKRG